MDDKIKSMEKEIEEFKKSEEDLKKIEKYKDQIKEYEDKKAEDFYDLIFKINSIINLSEGWVGIY